MYKHTVARIPDGMSENDAMSTAAACLVGIHCAAPRVVGVGGSAEEEGFYSGKVCGIPFFWRAFKFIEPLSSFGLLSFNLCCIKCMHSLKAVVVGGNEFACFIAE